MKTLKVVLQEVVSGLKSWVNTNTVHKTGNETINGVKTFSDGIVSDVTGSATSVPWSGVTGKPSDYPPSSHTHGNITNDGKVGTTANLPLITGTGGAVQAGSFGTSANTFCEGNDSRLSDARTPVAHTHTKSDVTDLLNSDFIPSANNSYNLGSSSYKWKTLNGINPGGLSLPNINYTEGNPDVYNVGTDINDQTKNTSDPLHLSWTSPFDGWLAIMWYLRDLTPPFNILITSHSDDRFSKFSQTWSASSTRWYLATTFPVVKNVTYYFHIDFQNTTIGVVHHAYLLPCLGNV